MANVILYFTMSLDGFVAGPKISRQDPMGIHGEELHSWMFDDKQAADEPGISRQHGNAGAVVLGRRTFDLGLEHWGDVPYPADSFVVTHRARDPLAQKSGTFRFVTDGVAAAVAEAKKVAGQREVKVMGAEVARQVLALGLADRIELQLSPLLLHGGERLFEGLEKAALTFTLRGPVAATSVAHLTFDVGHV
jgi:dihydrofolate reductase